ncbi:hypothetical protein [Yinghuangia seranimata]|uniref:hypothetical protein n=1 Tax=Yinghuangia seranimata TaxID=408067 RepID=UPI00248AF123|nr:hypothetical protein [Yinghuangia seranimata]
MPPYRALITVDAEKFSKTSDIGMPAVREAIRSVMRTALGDVGLDWDADVERCDDTGDGVIITLTDERVHLLVDAVHYLNRELRKRALRFDGPSLRLRAAVHCGPIDPAEGSGAAKIEVCRMSDAEVGREALRATASRVALLVSDQVFRTVVRGQGYAETVEESMFHRVDTPIKNGTLTVWVHVPANDWHPSSTAPAAASAATPEASAATAAPPPASPARAGQVHIGSVSGPSVVAETFNGGISHTTNSDIVHGHKGDNVYGDKQIGGAQDAG